MRHLARDKEIGFHTSEDRTACLSASVKESGGEDAPDPAHIAIDCMLGSSPGGIAICTTS